MKLNANNMEWCLIKEKAEEFAKKLESGEISPDIINKSTEERRKFFDSFLGEDGREVNLMLERKLLNKNRSKALISWAEEVSGKNTKVREDLKARIVENAKERLKRVFSPEENEVFLNDLAEARLGIAVTEKEARGLFELSKNLENAKELFNKNKLYGRLKEIKGNVSEKDRKVIDSLISKLEDKKTGKEFTSQNLIRIKRYLEKNTIGEVPQEVKDQLSKFVDDIVKSRKDPQFYGNAIVAMDDFVGKIKLDAIENYSLDMLRNRPVQFVSKAISEFASTTKTALSTLDASFIGRQGLPGLYRGLGSLAFGNKAPMKAWANAWKTTFSTLKKRGVNNEEALNAVRARVLSRENSMNGLYRKSKLDVGVMEESFPSALPERIPGVGRAIKASNEAFTASAYQMRSDLFDGFLETAKKNGVKISDEYLLGLGELVNSMTGRGKISFISEKAQQGLNVAFFSPKFLKSNVDKLLSTFYPMKMDGSRINPAVRKESFKNLLSIIAGVGTVMTIANALKPGSAETDPRSSDFGKIRIGDTRFDISGGMGSIVTLVSRLIGGSKSSTTGTVRDKGDFGGQSEGDLLYNFATNKLSPIARTIFNIYKKEDFSKNPLTIEAMKENPYKVSWILGKGLFIPIPLQNLQENIQSKLGGELFLAATLMDFIGIGTNTYSFTDRWETKDNEEMKTMVEKLGKAKVEEAGREYSEAVNNKLLELSGNEDFKNKSNDDKVKEIDGIKRKIKKEVFDKYEFYPSEKWEEKDTNEMIQFKEKLGENKLKEANKKYDKLVSEKLPKLKKADFYLNASEQERKTQETNLKEKIKQMVFKEYEFEAEDVKSEVGTKTRARNIKSLLK